MLNKSLVESMKVGDSKDLCVIRYPFLGMETVCNRHTILVWPQWWECLKWP